MTRTVRREISILSFTDTKEVEIQSFQRNDWVHANVVVLMLITIFPGGSAERTGTRLGPADTKIYIDKHNESC